MVWLVRLVLNMTVLGFCFGFNSNLQGGISWGENDHVQENADHVDGEAEEDGVLVVVLDDTPDKAEEKQQVVDQESLSSPVTEAGPGDQNEMGEEEEFQFDPRYVRPLQLNFLISHVDPGDNSSLEK